MTRRLVIGFCMIFLFVSASWAADLFLGTWTVDKQRLPQEIKAQMKDLPPGAIGDTLKVEAYKDGYKLTLTQTLHYGGKPQTYTYITIVDFKTGVSPVHNGQGEEIDRVKMVRISSTEIEATSLNYGGTLNYRVIDGGSSVEVRVFEHKGDKPRLTGYYKRVS